jgi:hypothetical protein
MNPAENNEAQIMPDWSRGDPKRIMHAVLHCSGIRYAIFSQDRNTCAAMQAKGIPHKNISAERTKIPYERENFNIRTDTWPRG